MRCTPSLASLSLAAVASALLIGAPVVRADAVIPIPVAPFAMTVNPITHDVWVTSAASDSVVAIDGGDHSVETIALGDQPQQVLVDPVRNRVWIAHAGPLVSVVDGVSHAVSTIALPGPTTLALDPYLGRAYAPVPSALHVIDADTLDVSVVPTRASGTVAVDPTTDGLVTLVASYHPDEFQYHYDFYRLAGSPPAVVDAFAVTGDQIVSGFAFDAHTGRSIMTGAFLGPIVIDFDQGAFAPADFFGFGAYRPVTEPTASRTWVPSNDPFTCAASFVYAFDTATLEQHGANALVPCFDSVAVNPATGYAYTTLGPNADFGDPSLPIHFIDADTLSVTTHWVAGYSSAMRPVVDVAANRIYVLALRQFTGIFDVVGVDEPVAAAVPIDVTISADPIEPGVDPVVHFTATSGFAPYPLPIRQIYWQVDATDSAWSYADAPGPAASATITGLAPGPHTVHAFATDGQEATTSPASTTPIVGPIATLQITVPPPPACSNGIDDDADGALDHPADSGCASRRAGTENPACNDGIDNDADGAVDHPADAQCFATWAGNEAGTGTACGLGVELGVLSAAFGLRSITRA